MDARTGLVIGGMTAVAASIAVVTAVALANTAALVDVPGTSVASERVVVPSTASPSATPRATPTAVAETVAPSAEPEVVEAPAPVVVDPPTTGTTRSPAAPATAPQVAAPVTPADIEPVIEAAKAAGSWDSLRTWAAEHGWTPARIEALVSRLEREAAEKSEAEKTEVAELPADGGSAQRQGVVGAQTEQQKTDADRTPNGPQRPAHAGSNAPERPAHAGSNVGNGNGAGHDAKKDQSRNSPDKRD